MRNSARPGGDTGPDTYVSINEVCRRFSFSRQTFYRMLGDPEEDLAELVVRVPPETGRIRVPLRAFEAWLKARARKGLRGLSPGALGESPRTPNPRRHSD